MNRISNFIRGFDSYGEPINVNYRGSNSYQTLLGGFLSIMVLTLVTLFTIVKTQQLILRASPTITTIEEVVSYLTDDEKFNLLDGQFDPTVSVQVHSDDPNVESRSWDALDEKFGRIIAQQVEVLWEYDEKGVSESHRG